MPINLINSVTAWLPKWCQPCEMAHATEADCVWLPAKLSANCKRSPLYESFHIIYACMVPVPLFLFPALSNLPPNNCLATGLHNIAPFSLHFVSHSPFNAHPHSSSDLKVTQFPIFYQNPKSKVRSDQGLKQERHLHQHRGRCQKILWGKKWSSVDSASDYVVEKWIFEQKIPKKIFQQVRAMKFQKCIDILWQFLKLDIRAYFCFEKFCATWCTLKLGQLKNPNYLRYTGV